MMGTVKRQLRTLANSLGLQLRLILARRWDNAINICHMGAWSGNMGDSVLLLGIQQELRRAAGDKPINFFPVNVQLTRVTPWLARVINHKFDLLLIGGGGLFLHKPESPSRSSWQLDITELELDILTIPVVVYGIGYNQFEFTDRLMPDLANRVLRHLQTKAALFSVRNRGTREEFIRRGLDPNKITVIPDPAMFVGPKPCPIPGLDPNKLNIGINLAADRLAWRYPAPAFETAKAWVMALGNALKAILAHHPGQIYYLSHMLKTDAFYTRILGQILGDKLIVLEDVLPQLFPPTLKLAPCFVDIYRQMSLVIGMRGHANIIPFGVATPVIAMSSHPKNRFFLEEIGTPEQLIDTRYLPDDATTQHIVQAVESTLARAEDLKAHYLKRKRELHQTAQLFNRQIVALLQ